MAHSNPIDWRYIKVNAQFTLLTELKDIEGKRVLERPLAKIMITGPPNLVVIYNRVATGWGTRRRLKNLR